MPRLKKPTPPPRPVERLQVSKLALSVQELAVATDLSKSYLYTCMREGTLKYLKAGSRRLVTVNEAEAFFGPALQWPGGCVMMDMDKHFMGKHWDRELAERYRLSFKLKEEQGPNDKDIQKVQSRPKGHHLVVIQRGQNYHLRVTWDEPNGNPSLSVRLSPKLDDGQVALTGKDMGSRLRDMADLMEGIVKAYEEIHANTPREATR